MSEILQKFSYSLNQKPTTKFTVDLLLPVSWPKSDFKLRAEFQTLLKVAKLYIKMTLLLSAFPRK